MNCCGKIYTILTHLAKKKTKSNKAMIRENWLNHLKRGIGACTILQYGIFFLWDIAQMSLSCLKCTKITNTHPHWGKLLLLIRLKEIRKAWKTDISKEGK